MRKLIPDFIVNMLQLGQLQGCMDTYVLNADLIGFTALTHKLMRYSHAGVEVLTDTINAVFTPALAVIESYGGFVTGFAGDAFTAVFTEGSAADALAAAIQIRDLIAQHGKQNTEFGEFELAVRIGVAAAALNWQILETEFKSVFWFSGAGIELAIAAQEQAQINEVIAHRGICNLAAELCQSLPINAEYSRIDYVEPLPLRIFSRNGDLSYALFLPEVITHFTAEGEFREVLSCFINMAVVDWEQIAFMVQSAEKNGGYFNHIDCTDKGWMAYIMFGAPLGYEETSKRAMGFADEVKSMCQQNIRIGLTQGKAFAGFIGSRDRAEYTAVGMAVNLAARFTMLAAWGDIYFDERIRLDLAETVLSESLGALDFMGYPHPITVNRLIAKLEPKSHGLYPNHFMGRAAELAQLVSSCAALWEGKSAGLSYVYGEAGQGKSRLVYELIQKLGNSVQCISLVTDPIHKSALNPFSYWIRDSFTDGLTGSIATRTDDFRMHWRNFVLRVQAMPDTVKIITELNRIESVLAGLIGLEWEGSVYANLEPRYRPSVTGFALKSLLEAYCRFGPVLLIVEDLHWLDTESEEVLSIITRRESNLPYKLIITSRPLDDGSHPSIDIEQEISVDIINMDGLNRSEVAQVMEDLLCEQAEPSLVDYAYEASRGNPFIVEQLSQYLLQSEHIIMNENGYRLSTETRALPEGVQALLVARIDRLDSELKRTVQVASVLGREFAVEVLSEMIEILENRPEYLNQLIVHSQLYAGEKGHIWNPLGEIKYLFSHNLLRDAAYDMQLQKQLNKQHLLAAQIMEVLYVGDKTQFAKIAEHLDFGGNWEKAIEYYNKAGDYERELYHFKLSLKYYGNGLLLNRKHRDDHHVELARSWDNVGTAYKFNGDLEQALRHHEQALSIRQEVLSIKHPDTADSYYDIGAIHFIQGDYDQALTFSEQALSIWKEVSAADSVEIAYCLNNIGNVRFRQKDYGLALLCYEQALAIQQNIFGPMHPQTAKALNNIGGIYSEIGEDDRALEYYEQALYIFKQAVGDLHPDTASSLNNMGNGYSNKGDFDRALEYYLQALTAFQASLGERHSDVAFELNNIGVLYDRQGELHKAISYYEQAVDIRTEVLGLKHPYTISAAKHLADAYTQLGSDEKAASYRELVELHG